MNINFNIQSALTLDKDEHSWKVYTLRGNENTHILKDTGVLLTKSATSSMHILIQNKTALHLHSWQFK